MTDTREEIESLVRSFVDELDSLVRKAALESVREALGEANTTGRRRAAPARARGRKKKKTTRKKRGRRRSRESTEKLAESLLDYLSKNPGSRMEQIREGMGVPTRTLRAVANKLIAQGSLRKKGEKRSTEYYVKGRRK